jgi:hypothetical protein
MTLRLRRVEALESFMLQGSGRGAMPEKRPDLDAGRIRNHQVRIVLNGQMKQV